MSAVSRLSSRKNSQALKLFAQFLDLLIPGLDRRFFFLKRRASTLQFRFLLRDKLLLLQGLEPQRLQFALRTERRSAPAKNNTDDNKK